MCADAWRMKNHLPFRLSGERLENNGGWVGLGLSLGTRVDEQSVLND